MQRLYKFFFILCIALFVISTLYAAVMSYGVFRILQANTPPGTDMPDLAFSSFIKWGSFQGLIFTLVEFLIIIFLLNRSVNRHRKYTTRNMIYSVIWFFIITTIVFAGYIVYAERSEYLSAAFLPTAPLTILPPVLWFPFPLAWLILLIVLAARIKKTS